MRILVAGNGFIGQEFYNASLAEGIDVVQACRHPRGNPDALFMDGTQPDTIASVLEEVRPEVIVDCMVNLGREGSGSVALNPIMTRNLLETAHAVGLPLFRAVVIGSAGEYGEVSETELPIKETASLNPLDEYSKSKKDATTAALKIAEEKDIPVVVARVFNPLGRGLHPTNIVSRMLAQVDAIRNDDKEPVIDVLRLEASRDYIHVADCIRALRLIAHAPITNHNVYNVGSGQRTTNQALIQSILNHSGFPDLEIRQTRDTPEPLTGAAHADVSRINELGWDRRNTVDEAIADIVQAHNK